MANTRITEKKWCDVRRPECSNPVFLIWDNHLRGVEGWLFEGNRRVEDADSDHQTFDKAYQDLRDTSYITGTVSKNRTQRIVLQASSLTQDQYTGILDIISSDKVQILTNPDAWEDDGPIWREVLVVPGSHATEEIETLKTITLTIELQPVLTSQR